jgi:hypothetical protein
VASGCTSLFVLARGSCLYCFLVLLPCHPLFILPLRDISSSALRVVENLNDIYLALSVFQLGTLSSWNHSYPTLSALPVKESRLNDCASFIVNWLSFFNDFMSQSSGPDFSKEPFTTPTPKCARVNYRLVWRKCAIDRSLYPAMEPFRSKVESSILLSHHSSAAFHDCLGSYVS